MKKKFWGLTSLVGAAAVIAVAFVVVPALGSSESAVVYDARGSDPYQFVGPGGTQLVTNGDKGCELAITDGDLVSLTGSGNGFKGVGLVGTSIGIKSGGSNGTPCSFTEFKSNETLTISSNQGPWNKLALDLELKDNAWVQITLDQGSESSKTFELVTGSSIEMSRAAPPSDVFPYTATSDTEVVRDVDGEVVSGLPTACANPSDSGPDSGANDNCYWTIDPGSSFTSFTISLLEGNVSLEGGGDDPSELEPTKFFYVTYDARDDLVPVSEDAPKTFDVLSNDLPDGVSGVSVAFDPFPSGFGGTFTPNGTTGEFTFDPGEDFQALPAGSSETVTLGYSGSVGGETDSAVLTLRVDGKNDEPEAVGGGSISAKVFEDSQGNEIQLATDPDDPDPLTATCELPSDRYTSQTDGSILYSPPPGDDTDESFTCTVTDDIGASTGSISVIVTIDPTNDSPVANGGSATMEHRVPVPGTDPFEFENNSVVVDVVDGLVDGSAADGAPTAADEDGDDLVVKETVEDGPSITGATSGTLLPSADLGSVSVSGQTITYTPGFSDDDWLDGVFSTVVDITYRVTDGTTPRSDTTDEDPDSEVVTLSVTINRVVCSAETVEDSLEVEGVVVAYGEFTLLAESNLCKPYSVSAEIQTQTDPALGDLPIIAFDPGEGETPVPYRGEIYGAPKPLVDGNLLFTVDYDPLGGSDYQTLLPCINPVFEDRLILGETKNVVVRATLPGTERWCLARAEILPAASNTSSTPTSDLLLQAKFEVYGEDDPNFRFR